MGRPDGFLIYERHENSLRDVEQRICDYEEIHTALRPAQRREQAARCMDCGVPFCQSGMTLNRMTTGCPLHNLIPEWNDHICRGNEAHGLRRLLKTNPFPEFTGRVCPALCEKACINGQDGDPVTIRDNELYLSEYAFENGLMKATVPSKRSDKKVAVIGSGPAGLSAAVRLNRRGHTVTVYERDDEIGGLLMYGIPNMKLDKQVIRRRRELMEKEGITFLTGIEIGKDIELQKIMETYDAVILACGAKKERMPALDGIEGIKGIVKAVDFLKGMTKVMPDLPEINAQGKHVVILGGGDTGNDCAAACIRQKCTSLIQVEMMKQPPLERREDNPWPQWPLVLKTDYGQEEAIHVFGKDPRIFSSTVSDVTVKDGFIREAEIAEVSFESGKMKLSEKRSVIPCDLLIIAAGFTGCERELPESAGIALSSRNTIQTQKDHYMSSVPGIFTAGDMHRGTSLVVWAIAEGLECAREADEWMMGYTNLV